MKFSIIIPNWNGRKLLEKNLPAVLAAGADEVIVSDDGSTDGSVEFLKRYFSQVKIVEHKRLGFAGNCNRGVEAAKGGIIILLNTDVIPEKDFLKPLEEDFTDPKIFAISFNEINDPKLSWTKGKFESGFIIHEPQKKDKTVHQTFWASGGSGAFRKSMWKKLGGMDALFNPFYWEDLDLCYRAQKRGWEILWDPRSHVIHKHEGVIKGNFSPKYIDLIWERNQLIFIWKNLTDCKLFLRHILGMLWRLLHPGYLKVILTAGIKLPQILAKRFKEKKEMKLSDKRILKISNS